MGTFKSSFRNKVAGLGNTLTKVSSLLDEVQKKGKKSSR